MITVVWENPYTLHLHYSRGWDWADVHDSFDRARAMMQTVTHPIAVIHTFELNSRIPAGNPIPHFKRLFMLTPSHVKLNLLVTGQNRLNGFYSTLSGLFVPKTDGRSFRFVASYAEALALCQSLQQDQV
ncbi:MAG: hypothetical protein MUF87_13340 [Anaerolineae bacterium]|jgi:hypothetical protein|nr:hypothetical protein [Anaerolineae bacterium]